MIQFHKISREFKCSQSDGSQHQETQKSDDWCLRTTEAEVHSCLRRLSPGKSSGPDGIPCKIFRFLADIIATPLAYIFNKSLEERVFPKAWKDGVMIPIPKTNPPSIDKLRLITLQWTPSKILERLVLNSLVGRFEAAYGIHQHGFRRKHSTTTALVDIMDTLTQCLDDPSTPGVALLSFDLSRAFDTLEHSLLMRSLTNAGFPVGFLDWIESYLSSRTVRLKVNGNMSTPISITRGVPQGSVLGPALFCAFMGSLTPPEAATSIVTYADDIHAIVPFPTDNVNDISQKVQQLVSHIQSWTSQQSLTINLSKSHMMIISRRHAEDVTRSFPIPVVNEMKILGVMVNNKLSWSTHVKYISAKANRRFFILRRLKPLTSKEDLHMLYCSLIRSVLEYACPVYAGINKGMAASLQRLDNRAHRLIFNEHHGSSNVRTCDCTMNCLQKRRHEQCLKLLNTFLASPSHVLHSRVPMRGNSRFILQFCRTALRQSSFFPFSSMLSNTL